MSHLTPPSLSFVLYGVGTCCGCSRWEIRRGHTDLAHTRCSVRAGFEKPLRNNEARWSPIPQTKQMRFLGNFPSPDSKWISLPLPVFAFYLWFRVWSLFLNFQTCGDFLVIFFCNWFLDWMHTQNDFSPSLMWPNMWSFFGKYCIVLAKAVSSVSVAAGFQMGPLDQVSKSCLIF